MPSLKQYAQRGKDERFEGFSDLVHRYLSRQLHEKSGVEGTRGADLYPLARVWDEAREQIQQTRIFNLDKKQTVHRSHALVGQSIPRRVTIRTSLRSVHRHLHKNP